MKFYIEIDDRTGECIKRFCKLNNMTYNAYLGGIIEKQFVIDMYGDINDKLDSKKTQSSNKEEKQTIKKIDIQSDVVNHNIAKEANISATEIQNKTKRSLTVK